MTKEHTNTLYLVRHGENPANITHKFSYKDVDYSLTPKGVLQAQQTADYFQDKHIDEIYASPLKRASETANIIAQALELPVTIMEDFREVNVGSLEGCPPTEENWRFHNRIVQDWFEGKYTSTFPDGENYITLLQRMRAGLLAVTRHKTGHTIVTVAHGGIISRTLKDICPSLDIKDVLHQPNHNCAITRIELVTNDEHVLGTLKLWASYAHLHGEAANLGMGSALLPPDPVDELQ